MNPPSSRHAPQGDWRIRHPIPLACVLDDALQRQVATEIAAQHGVIEVRVTGSVVRVRYDQTRIDFDTLCQVLRGMRGVALQRDQNTLCGRFARFMARWHQYTDETGCENAARPQAPCCNRMPRRR